jgi:hypothetical protein
MKTTEGHIELSDRRRKTKVVPNDTWTGHASGGGGSWSASGAYGTTVQRGAH